MQKSTQKLTYVFRFRWAVCQLDALRSCVNLYGLRKKLASLPKDLDETYDRILDSIDEDNQQDALKILQWLTYSARPLLLGEVAEVIAIDVNESPRFNPDKRYPEPQDILTICSSLISLQEEVLEDNDPDDPRVIVQLAHFTVKEYLISQRIQKGRLKQYSIQEVDANAFIAESSLAYLLQFDEPDSLTTKSVGDFPLADYAAEYWTEHARLAERDSNLAPLLSMELLSTKGYALLNWIRLYNLEKPWELRYMSKGLDEIYHPLYYASLAGLIGSVKSILERGDDIDAQGGYYHNALQAASYQGHTQVVQILLSQRADINAQGGYHGSALQAASHQGHDQVVQMLLNHGANINAQGGFHGTALQAASIKGHDQVVQMLLNQEAHINAQGGWYGNALQAASVEGYDRVVWMLLDQGADINAQGGDYGTALQAASAKGHKQVVQILVNNGANVNAQGGAHGNALQAALARSRPKIIQDIFDKVDTNGQGLQAANNKRYDIVVQILLDNGADVNTLDEYYGEKLYVGLREGKYYLPGVDVETLLIKKGSDAESHSTIFMMSNPIQGSSTRPMYLSFCE